MIDNKNIIKISDYYKDFEIPNECFKIESLRNLLELSATIDVNLIDKKKKKVKPKKKIINECNKLKKIKIKELTKQLNDINLTDTDVSSSAIIDTNKKFVNGIENIDNVIKIINKKDDDILYLNKLLSDTNDFIETFSN